MNSQLVGFISLDHAGVRHTFTAQEIALAQGMADLAALTVERERLQLAHTIAQAKALSLTETNGRLHTFLGIASHELRTPITSIKAGVQLTARMVRQAATPDIPETNKTRLGRAAVMLDSANQQVEKLNRFITDLLDMTRIQAGTLAVHPTQIDFATIILETTENLQLNWPKRKILIELPDAPVILAADADRLGQVVANLITNALKYSPEETPVRVQLTTTLDAAQFAVIDHGPGLSAEQQAQLFQAFGRVEDVPQLSGAGIGLGLGLFICKTIIDSHHGQIGVISEPTQGATFWCSLPLHIDA